MANDKEEDLSKIPGTEAWLITQGYHEPWHLVMGLKEPPTKADEAIEPDTLETPNTPDL